MAVSPRNINSPRRLYPSTRPASARPVDSTKVELRPRGHSPKEIRAWMLRTCGLLDLKPTTWAKKANIAPSTINRFLNETNVNENISAKTIDRLVEAATVVFEKRGGSTPSAGELRPNAQLIAVSPIFVLGYVQAGVFQEALEWEKSERYQVHLPVPTRYFNKPVIGLEIRGPSMDQVFPDGTIVMCVSYWDLERAPRSGEHVVIHKRGANGYEATIKEYMVDPNANAWLMPKSSHPDHQQGIFLGKNTEHFTDDSIEITFLVIGSFKPEIAIPEE